jgi:hypothetical protein
VLPEGGSLMAALEFKPLLWFIVNVSTAHSYFVSVVV